MASKPEIIVYQQGKVGSSAVVAAVKRAGFPVAHVHTLDVRKLEALSRRAEGRGAPQPPHVETALRVRHDYLEAGRPMRVISAVRDPVTRNLSAFFQNIESHCPNWRGLGEDAVDVLSPLFFENYSHRVATGWFDMEFKTFLGIDIYSAPFNHERGYGEYRSDAATALVLRAEGDDRNKEEIISRFLDGAKIRLRRENKGAEKAVGALYERMKSEICFPKGYLDRMYESKMAKYFYTDEERAAFRNRLAVCAAQEDMAKRSRQELP